jgi:hypothetical protein
MDRLTVSLLEQNCVVKLINGVELKELPAKMFVQHEERILNDLGRTLDSLQKDGLTVQQAFIIVTKSPAFIKETEESAYSSEYFLKGTLYHWLINNAKETIEKATMNDTIEVGMTELKEQAKQLFTTQELIDTIDRPGFAWDNLNEAEQRNLTDSLNVFVRRQIAKYGKSLDKQVIVYQYRYKENNENCVDYGQWSDWKDCKNVADYEDIQVYISWGKTYEVRKLAVLDDDSTQKKIDTLFDAIKHGDEEHQAWLKSAIEAHFAGNPMPEYVAGKNSKIKVELAEGEPFFVLRGRDPQAPDLIEDWATARYKCEPHSGKAESAYAVARSMREFKTANPELGMARSLYRQSICVDISKLNAWNNSLDKGILLCEQNHRTGDAKTLLDIKNYLARNESFQPKISIK